MTQMNTMQPRPKHYLYYLKSGSLISHHTHPILTQKLASMMAKTEAGIVGISSGHFIRLVPGMN
jgi:hypothetical protein